MHLSIITINFKKPLLTIACIASVYATYQTFFEKNEFELLIVDNFSQDDSVAVLEKEIKKQKYRNVSVLAHKENNGFGGGNNFGVQHAQGEYLLFLNNDTIVGKGIDTMLSFLSEHPEIGIVGGPLQNPHDGQQSSAGKFYSVWRVILLLLGLQRFGLDASPIKLAKVDWVKGALLMMRKAFFEKLGGFDEKIFMYTEDMELCFRATKMGKSVWFYPDVQVVHEDQGSSNRTFAIVHIYQGIIYFYQKHQSAFALGVVKLLLQIKAVVLVSLGKVIKNSYLVSTYEKALNVIR